MIKQQMPEARVVFGIILGTGVGGGIVVNGSVLNGRQGIAGEWGHNFLDESGGICYCGKSGCVERVISGPALQDYYTRLTGNTLKLEQICDKYLLEGDTHAGMTIDRLVENFGKSIAAVINIIDPDAVVIGGGSGQYRITLFTRRRGCQALCFQYQIRYPLFQTFFGRQRRSIRCCYAHPSEQLIVKRACKYSVNYSPCKLVRTSWIYYLYSVESMREKTIRYKQIHRLLKKQIQQGDVPVGALLPSENELCQRFSITRTTARKALEELQKEGFIERHHGKGSIVTERRKTLGLLNVKGFSEAVGDSVQTFFLQHPVLAKWPSKMTYPARVDELASDCVFFKRLRSVKDQPVMLESNWFSAGPLQNFTTTPFIEGSFFKTLSRRYLIEIVGSEQELRAEYADEETARILNIEVCAPVLHISVKFFSSIPQFNIYSELFCDTNKYPVSNRYHL